MERRSSCGQHLWRQVRKQSNFKNICCPASDTCMPAAGVQGQRCWSSMQMSKSQLQSEAIVRFLPVIWVLCNTLRLIFFTRGLCSCYYLLLWFIKLLNYIAFVTIISINSTVFDNCIITCALLILSGENNHWNVNAVFRFNILESVFTMQMFSMSFTGNNYKWIWTTMLNFTNFMNFVIGEIMNQMSVINKSNALK